MYISKFRIRNYKCFRDVTIHFNPDVNVITGVNNAGKTTLLEALALWHECFQKLITECLRNEPKSKTRRGDYRLGTSQPYYFSDQEIRSVRSPSFEDIFFMGDTKSSIGLTATFTEPGEASLEIPFEIAGGRRNTYHIKCGLQQFDHFNSFFKFFPKPIQTVFCSPVAGILQEEEFHTKPKTKVLVTDRLAAQVMRNRIHELSGDIEGYEDLKKKLSKILTDDTNAIDFVLQGRVSEDVNCKVGIKLGHRSTPRDLSLVGSGTLQIIELLLALIESKTNLNMILLDEPDSHLHRQLQDRLYKTLSNFNKGPTKRPDQHYQIFLTTHNESLIRAANPEAVFHLDGAPDAEYANILQNTPRGVKQGLQPTGKAPIFKSLGSESALELITALESDQLFLIEGMSDAYFLQSLVKGIRLNPTDKFMFWSYDGIDTILKNLKVYKQILGSIRNQVSLWEKSVLVLDRDYLTLEQCQYLEKAIQSKYGIPVAMWKSSMMESSFLKEIPKLALALLQMLRTRRPGQDISFEVRGQLEAALVEAFQSKIDHYLRLVTERNDEAADFETKVKAYYQKTKGFVDDLELNKKDSPFHTQVSSERRYTEFCEALKLSLGHGALYTIANKDDVAEIINAALATQGESFEVSQFPELFATIGGNTQIDLWDPFLAFM